jgi:hypothetical protein
MANAMLRRKPTEPETFRKEDELLGFARSYLSDAFPNPERTGCPSDEALRLLAMGSRQSVEFVGEHLTYCSPCFNAYMGHLARARAKLRRNTWIKRSAAACGVAAVLAIVIYLVLANRRNPVIIAPRQQAPIIAPEKPQATATYVPVLVDLSNASPTRGSKQNTVPPVPQVIPSSSPVAMSLRLPLGSEEQLYVIALRSGRNIVWSESAQARRENGDTLLRIHADFKDFPSGIYSLQVSSSATRLSMPVLIKAAPPESTEQKR